MLRVLRLTVLFSPLLLAAPLADPGVSPALWLSYTAAVTAALFGFGAGADIRGRLLSSLPQRRAHEAATWVTIGLAAACGIGSSGTATTVWVGAAVLLLLRESFYRLIRMGGEAASSA